MMHVLLVLSLLFKNSICIGILSLQLIKYNNSEGKDNNGNCCDLVSTRCHGRSKCDHYFNVCLDFRNGSPTDMNQCRIGKYTTGVTYYEDTINFRSKIGSAPNQKRIRFNKWQGGFILKVEVWDHDIGNDDDFIDFLTTNVTIRPTIEKTRGKGCTAKGRTQLDFRVKVICDRNWYGPSCDIECRPPKGGDRHECAPNGTKICDQGWTGANCDVDINESQSDPCSNPGTIKCVNNRNGCICKCKPGYTGIECETDIDECDSQPCHNNATCHDLSGHFKCECTPQFTGIECETGIDECDSQPCHNNATCHDLVGHFKCECTPQFTGQTCDIQQSGTTNNETASVSFSGQPQSKMFIAGAVGPFAVFILISVVVVFILIWRRHLKKPTEQSQPPNQDYSLNEDVLYYDIQPVIEHQSGMHQSNADDDRVFYMYDNPIYEGPSTYASGMSSINNECQFDTTDKQEAPETVTYTNVYSVPSKCIDRRRQPTKRNNKF